MKRHFTFFFSQSRLGIALSVFTIIVLLGTVVMTGLYHTHSTHVVHAAPAPDDWPSYSFNNRRVGFNNAETIINQTTAPKLKLHWSHLAAAIASNQAVEANSLIYWGSWDGLEHATDLNGTDVWTANLGTSTASCSPSPTGVGSTATIGSIMLNGILTSVDYVGGGDGQLYALNAATGAIIWQTSLRSSANVFLWSSPLLYNGSIYEGVAALTDCPTVQGQMIQLDATSGAIQHSFNVVPNGCKGGGVWGSPAIDQVSNMLYFATGNSTNCVGNEPYTSALVELSATDLSFVSSWQVPVSQQTFDSDFGNTPTIFPVTINGTKHLYVSVGNKNGIYYTFDTGNISKGPVWTYQIAVGGSAPDKGQGTISPSAWNGSTLFVAGGNTTINGNQCLGSLQALDPATGAIHWQDCLASGPVIGAVSAVPGLVVVGSAHTMIVVSAKTGATLFSYQVTHGLFWSGASIANGVLYMTNSNHNLYAFGL